MAVCFALPALSDRLGYERLSGLGGAGACQVDAWPRLELTIEQIHSASVFCRWVHSICARQFFLISLIIYLLAQLNSANYFQIITRERRRGRLCGGWRLSPPLPPTRVYSSDCSLLLLTSLLLFFGCSTGQCTILLITCVCVCWSAQVT